MHRLLDSLHIYIYRAINSCVVLRSTSVIKHKIYKKISLLNYSYFCITFYIFVQLLICVYVCQYLLKGTSTIILNINFTIQEIIFKYLKA